METIPIIELDQSDPEERGHVYGEAAREKIREILGVYRELFSLTTGEPWEKIIARGESILPGVQAFAPDLSKEGQRLFIAVYTVFLMAIQTISCRTNPPSGK